VGVKLNNVYYGYQSKKRRGLNLRGSDFVDACRRQPYECVKENPLIAICFWLCRTTGEETSPDYVGK